MRVEAEHFEGRHLRLGAVLMSKPADVARTLLIAVDIIAALQRNADRSFTRLEESGYGAQERRLAGAVGSFKREDLTARNGKAEIAEQHPLASPHGKVRDFEAGRNAHAAESIHVLAAIDRHGRSGDEACTIRNEKQYAAGDFFGFAEPSHGNLGDDLFENIRGHGRDHV